MALVDLSRGEREVVGQCLRALAHGPFLPDWEFDALTGFTRGELVEIAGRWPDLDESVMADRLAIHAALGMLLSGPIRRSEHWAKYLDVTRDELELIYRKWWRETRRSYLDDLRSLVEAPWQDQPKA